MRFSRFNMGLESVTLQIVKVEVHVRKVRQVISKLLNLTKTEAGSSDEACEDEN